MKTIVFIARLMTACIREHRLRAMRSAIVATDPNLTVGVIRAWLNEGRVA